MLRFRSLGSKVKVGLVLGCLGCSSARLDPNTRAFTFDTPTAASSVEPSSTAAIPVASASAPAMTPREPTRHRCSRLPDPAATVTDDWFVLDIHYEQGKLTVTRVTREQSPKRETTPRRIGRFSAELWIGCELLERANFDFPLLGTETSANGQDVGHSPDFERNARFDTRVRIPNLERATRLELYDRTRDGHSGPLLTVDFPLTPSPGPR